MKLHQPTPSTIYFILQGDTPKDISVNVAFDDEAAANAYISRFKTFGDAEIVACHLNPGFYTDITRDCYFIQLNLQNDIYVISLANDLQRSELAIAGHYFFEAEQICTYVMSESETEAIKLARAIKNQALAKQEFVIEPVQIQ
jgi:hypothetical protein